MTNPMTNKTQETKATQATQETPVDENEQIAQRKTKLAELRQNGEAFPNHFKPDSIAHDLHDQYGTKTKEELETANIKVKLAGRMLTQRIMGKASFATMQDASGKMQIYVMRDRLPEGVYQQFKHYDLGDIVAVEGVLFKTRTDELTIKVDTIELLTKSLRPLPDKFHGLTDVEQRYRQRYVDLMVNEEARRVFRLRSKLVTKLRDYFNQRDFMEVETPMMHAQPGGATAKPFMTHHNALDMELYMRVAPELYLKRLVVGSFDRVYEVNRNFRNEGVSTRHNPEFTMLEFYQAYSTYHDLIDLTEDLLKYLAKEVLGQTSMQYQGTDIDFSEPFARMTIKQSILHYNPDINPTDLDELETAKPLATKYEVAVQEGWGLGKIQMELFEKLVERRLMEPTFITEYPTEISPLARRNSDNPFVTDRFEFFVGGQEIANGFSELNDSEDQAERFNAQIKAKEAGDDEAMSYDHDYITALEYGLPPTAGEGIGIDRLVMLFADVASIRDVILFPLMRRL